MFLKRIKIDAQIVIHNGITHTHIYAVVVVRTEHSHSQSPNIHPQKQEHGAVNECMRFDSLKNQTNKKHKMLNHTLKVDSRRKCEFLEIPSIFRENRNRLLDWSDLLYFDLN